MYINANVVLRRHRYVVLSSNMTNDEQFYHSERLRDFDLHEPGLAVKAFRFLAEWLASL